MLPYEEVIRVPCLWSAPSGARGAEPSVPVSLLDLAPTVLDYAGVPLDRLVPAPQEGVMPEGLEMPWFDGVSLRETLDRGCDPPERGIIVSKEETRFFREYADTRRAIRGRTFLKGDHKLVIFADPSDNAFYDLASGPGETRNLWDDPAAAQTKAKLLADYASQAAWSEYAGRGRIGGA
jgi:arylsulfatase